MDHIDKHLTTTTTLNKCYIAIKAALAIGKKTLYQYYKTDHSKSFWIEMGVYGSKNLIFSHVVWQYCFSESLKSKVRSCSIQEELLSTWSPKLEADLRWETYLYM